MQIRFAGYTAECRVSGILDLTAERLAEMLNAMDAIELGQVVVESLDDARLVALDEAILRRDDLYVVEATSPRGAPALRIQTEQHRLQVHLGPFLVLGRLHVPPGDLPLRSIAARGPMVPLTAATIAYVSGGQLRMHDAETLLVNRGLADWVAAASADARLFPGVPIVSRLNPTA